YRGPRRPSGQSTRALELRPLRADTSHVATQTWDRVALGEQFEQVLAAARAGGDWAWRELYFSVAPSVLGYLRGRGAPDPEDLLGEVFLHVVRGLGSFQGGENAFRGW